MRLLDFYAAHRDVPLKLQIVVLVINSTILIDISKSANAIDIRYGMKVMRLISL